MSKERNTDNTQVFSFFEALVHPIRASILRLLHDHEELSYSEILSYLQIDTGKLNFHFKKLNGLIEKTPSGSYRLTSKGLLAISALKAVKEHLGVTDKEDIKTHFIRRFFAWLVDVILISAFAFGDFNMALVNFVEASALFNTEILIPLFFYRIIKYLFFIRLGPLNNLEQLSRIYLLSILWIYWTLLEGYRGQSIGKMLLGIKIVKTDRGIVQLHDSAISAFGKAFILPIDLLVGILMKIIRKRYFIRFTEGYTHIMTVRASVKF
ncbi:MAG: RDD family protein [Candidatus Odinarchaeota archaeon]|nr:RDD family protein [Candidatus Odinarchaeota archaeon]